MVTVLQIRVIEHTIVVLVLFEVLQILWATWKNNVISDHHRPFLYASSLL